MSNQMPDYENMSSEELAQVWGLNSDEVAVNILNRLHEKDSQIAKLYSENSKLKTKASSSGLWNGIGKFIGNSWGWIFVFFFFFGPSVLYLLDKAITPQCSTPQEQIKKESK